LEEKVAQRQEEYAEVDEQNLETFVDEDLQEEEEKEEETERK